MFPALYRSGKNEAIYNFLLIQTESIHTTCSDKFAPIHKTGRKKQKQHRYQKDLLGKSVFCLLTDGFDRTVQNFQENLILLHCLGACHPEHYKMLHCRVRTRIRFDTYTILCYTKHLDNIVGRKTVHLYLVSDGRITLGLPSLLFEMTASHF